MSTLFFRHPGEADLALFAGGELGPLARWRIEGHLSRCAPCRKVVCEFFELRSKVIDLAELPPIDWAQLAARIHRQAEGAGESSAPATMLRPAWGAVAALLVLIAAGLYLINPFPKPAGPVRLDASAGGVELRVGDRQVLTLLNTSEKETQVSWRVSADAVSARYLDASTGLITVNNVYAQ